MSKSANVKALLKTAQEDGSISPDAMKALTIIDRGAEIQAGLGVSVDDVKASEVVLVTMLIDDSGSIRFGSNAQAVRDGHNTVIGALTDSKQKDGVLAHTRYLNGTVLYPYSTIDQAVKMDSHNFDPNGGTPLFDQTITTLGTVLAKAQDFADAGVPVRTVTLIVTDGADEHSRRASAKQVEAIVKDMLKAETHIVCAMGVSDGSTDFKQVFNEMGIPDQWILTPGNTPSELRRAFQVFSQSAVRASQGAASFSKTAVGGFGN